MREFNLNKIKAAGTTVGDVYFPQTKLLLPFDGTNGATTTSDLSTKNYSSTFNGSNFLISTAQSKFGTSSLFRNTESSTTDNVSLGAHSDWLMNQNTEYTLEFWYRALNTTDGTIISCGEHGSALQYRVYAYGGGGILFQSGTGGWNWGSVSITGGTLTVDTWKHVALVRHGGTLTLYVDGTGVGSAITGNWGNSTARTLRIGSYFSTASIGYFYLDDLRITKGVARYTSNFTPPTTAHLTSAGDVNKQIIINSTADGVAIGTGGINQARIIKAWCNFDGDGTVSIRGSYNVSSVTDNGTGDYTVNFSTAMSDTNFAASITSADIDDNGSRVGQSVPFIGSGNSGGAYANKGVTTSSCRIHICYTPSNSGLTLEDIDYVHALFFGN